MHTHIYREIDRQGGRARLTDMQHMTKAIVMYSAANVPKIKIHSGLYINFKTNLPCVASKCKNLVARILTYLP